MLAGVTGTWCRATPSLGGCRLGASGAARCWCGRAPRAVARVGGRHRGCVVGAAGAAARARVRRPHVEGGAGGRGKDARPQARRLGGGGPNNGKATLLICLL